jgi:hypothetical protein
VGGNWLLQVERRRDVDLRAVTMLAMTLNLAARQVQPSGTSGKDKPLRHLARTVNPTATRDAASKSAGGGAEGGKRDDDLETAMQNVEDDFPVGFIVPLVFLFGALAVACCFRFMAQGNSKKHRTVYVDARPPNTSAPPPPAHMIVKNKSALPEPAAPGPPPPPRANKGEEMGVYTFIASQAVAPPKPPATPPSPIFATAHSRLHGGEGLAPTPRHPAVEQMLASLASVEAGIAAHPRPGGEVVADHAMLGMNKAVDAARRPLDQGEQSSISAQRRIESQQRFQDALLEHVSFLSASRSCLDHSLTSALELRS